MHLSEMMFSTRHLNFLPLGDVAMVALSQPPELRILIQTCSNLHLSTKSINLPCLHGGKTGFIWCITKDSEQNWSYTAGIFWEHMLGTHAGILGTAGNTHVDWQPLWLVYMVQGKTQSKSCITMHGSRLLVQALLTAGHHVRDHASASEIKQLILKLSCSFKVFEKFVSA